MKPDFTITSYIELLKALDKAGYRSRTFAEYMSDSSGRFVILRHDVDKIPENSRRFARIEADMGFKASYYFRMVKCSFKEMIIKRISELGHEIGYHYEDMDLCKGDIDHAWRTFKTNLEVLRVLADIHTVCMHGSPLSPYDNRDLWTKYDYRSLGIIGEPYFDIDYNVLFYITDTGRKWNAESTSIRDHVNSRFNYNIKSTYQLCELILEGHLPDQIMINTHPQRWTDDPLMWAKELVLQNIKNQVKMIRKIYLRNS